MVTAVASRARLRRHPERGIDDADELAALLADAVVAHVGIVEDGWPVVVPMLLEPDGDRVYVHGARRSRLLRHLSSGAPACVSVCLLDELVASRDALNHSANYRSAVLFCHGAEVLDRERKRAILERMTARIFCGRAVEADYRAATAAHLDAVRLVELRVDERSGKRRQGPPTGPRDAREDGDPALPWSRGVTPPGPDGGVSRACPHLAQAPTADRVRRD